MSWRTGRSPRSDKWPFYLDAAKLKRIVHRLDPAADLTRIERWSPNGFISFRYLSGGRRFFLRIADTPSHSFAAEAAIIRRFDQAGVAVPKVIHLDDAEPETGRALIVVSEVPGQTIRSASSRFGNLVLHDVGGQLARARTIQIEGFGPILRDKPWSGEISGPHTSFRRWTRDEQPFANSGVLEQQIGAQRLERFNEICGAIRRWVSVVPTLAHGAVTRDHLFRDQTSFTGFIDFGSVCGADRWYDLATLLVSVPWVLSMGRDGARAILSGYAREAPLSDDDLECLRARVVTLLPSSGENRSTLREVLDRLMEPGFLIQLMRRGS